MPIGIQRLNAKKSQPNPHVVFIKPLSGPNESTAQNFLERIAAQCLPVMRKNHISIMTLEEYEPNREFVGRNFNAGEVIQLVLRSPSTGRWLPFEYVQMVMMHELAHCKQMNHSRAFWAVRNQYAEQMHALWRDGYTGDGIWGRGAKLVTGEWERNQVQADEVLPEHLCGGTYRSRRRKRKAKLTLTLTYQERKERRILKKFGKNGVALGADDEAKVKLERGKRVQAKPRVASSARGRELRAAAALARFEQQKVEVKDEVEAELKEEEEEETDSGSGSEYDDAAGVENAKDAVDVDGSAMRDSKGRGMVRVCEDEDTSDPDARNELAQLADTFRRVVKREDPESTTWQTPRVKEEEAEPAESSTSLIADVPVKGEPADAPSHLNSIPSSSDRRSKQPALQSTRTPTSTCSMCSFINAPHAVTCSMCVNVLDPGHTPNSWRCGSATCTDGQYVNSGDCGVCGLCGKRRVDE